MDPSGSEAIGKQMGEETGQKQVPSLKGGIRGKAHQDRPKMNSGTQNTEHGSMDPENTEHGYMNPRNMDHSLMGLRNTEHDPKSPHSH